MERAEGFQQVLKLAENRLFLPDFERDLKVPVRRLKRDSTDSVEQARYPTEFYCEGYSQEVYF